MASKARTASSKSKDGADSKRWLGSQTLVRGLEVMEAVAAGVNNLAGLAEAVKLNRSTAHRLASTLVERRYLSFTPRHGYGLGPKALEIGHRAHSQLDIPRLARKPIEKLAALTGDTVHLGVRDGSRVLYLDKIPGRRRIEISSRVGELQPMRSTGLGKALLLDEDESTLRATYRSENGAGQRYAISESAWLKRMRDYASQGCAFDLEENEDRIRCVSAPIRDASGDIRAAISVSSAAHYMSDKRMESLVDEVRATAEQISVQMGWQGAPPKRTRKAA